MIIRQPINCGWSATYQEEICTKAIDLTLNILLEVLLLRGTMNHCESLSHQLRDARRAILSRRKINRRENVPGNRRRERDGRPCRRMTSEWENDWRSRQTCRSACSPENEGKGEHRVRVTFDRPLFDTSKIKKAQDSVAVKKTSATSSEQCFALRWRRWFNHELISQKKYTGKDLSILLLWGEDYF